MKLRLLTIPALIFLGGFSLVSAQSYDDDDIYFNPDKAKKAVPVKRKQPALSPMPSYTIRLQIILRLIRIHPFNLPLPEISTNTTVEAFSLPTQYLSILSET